MFDKLSILGQTKVADSKKSIKRYYIEDEEKTLAAKLLGKIAQKDAVKALALVEQFCSWSA